MNDTTRQKMKLLYSINELLDDHREGNHLTQEHINDIRSALALEVFGLPTENIMFSALEHIDTDFDEFCKYFQRFVDSQGIAAANSATISSAASDMKYGSDREFLSYIDTLAKFSHKTLYALVYENLVKVKNSAPNYYKLITEGSRGWYFENNWLDGVGGKNNSLITNRIAVLKDNIDRLVWLYANLADAVSRRSLNALIKFWLTWDYSDWRNVALYYCDVVDTAIFPFYDEEVFVDCGSYIGDTVLQYIGAVNDKYKRIYTYDISKKSIEVIKTNLAKYPNIMIKHKGTGEVNTVMAEVGVDQAFHGNKLSENAAGNVVDMVNVVRLDDDITEPITFLKVDCEGMDKETLRGAKKHIQRYHPKLHVDSYHKLADLVDIPELIRSFDSSYCIFMRLVLSINGEPRFPTPAFMAI